MKLPRDLSGQDLAKALRKLDTRLTTQRQAAIGHHHRLTRDQLNKLLFRQE